MLEDKHPLNIERPLLKSVGQLARFKHIQKRFFEKDERAPLPRPLNLCWPRIGPAAKIDEVGRYRFSYSHAVLGGNGLKCLAPRFWKTGEQHVRACGYGGWWSYEWLKQHRLGAM